MTGVVLIGTSGYSYKDWVGHFYPPGLPQREMLSYYSRHFSFTEINSTYYRLPHQKTFTAMLGKVPADFIFAVKAYQGLTHKRTEASFEEARAFRAAVTPLAAEERLGAILLQFPYSFPNTEPHRAYISHLRDILANLPLVVEFRHRSWINESTFEFLRRLEIGFTLIDAPPVTGFAGPIVRSTAPIGYIRFHGRNSEKWWVHEEAYERYNYFYSEEELREWVPRIWSLSKEVATLFIAFNNHYQAQAVRNANMLKALLSRQAAVSR